MDKDDIEDLFRAVGPVSIRRMFGGKGIYADGMIIAIELRGEIMLKGDATAGPLYEEAGSRRWSYTHAKTGTTAAMPYWQMPLEAFDDPEEAARWTCVALEAARRATAKS